LSQEKLTGIREDFPLLKKGWIYLDNTAKAQTPRKVLDAMHRYYTEIGANVHRGLHTLSLEASKLYDEAHSKVEKFIGARKGEVAFTLNTTHAINIVASSIDWKRGDEVVTTVMEHHSNFLPWLRLRKFGVKVRVVDISDQGFINVDQLRNSLTERTKLVSVAHVSNVLGVINPLEEIREIIDESDASPYFLVDAAQSVGHVEFSVRDFSPDFLAFSGYKGLMGPTGIGGLYYRRDVWEEIEPALLGGGTPRSVDSEGYELMDPPASIEAGTPNIAGAIGLSAAVEYVSEIGIRRIEKKERELTSEILDGFERLKEGGVKVEYYGPGLDHLESRIGVISFNLGGKDPHDVARAMSSFKICLRSGHHCAMPLAMRLGITRGSVRASLHVYNTMEEIETFLTSLKEVYGLI